MRIPSFALTIPLVLTLAAGCLTEGDPDLDVEDESSVTQDIDRGWFGLYIDGIGSRTTTAAGLFMELYVGYYSSSQIGYVGGYVQRWNSSPPTSWLTGIVVANCSDGSQPYAGWNYVITPTHSHTVSVPRATCPPGTGINDAYFLLHVDN
jgi:hypothetical protein